MGRALVADLAVPELRATAYGILNAVGLAILPASIVAGLLRTAPANRPRSGSRRALGGLALLFFVRPIHRRAGAPA